MGTSLPSISALVHYQGGCDPGSGFYRPAQDLGLLHNVRLTAEEKMAFHIGQINALQEHYALAAAD